MNAHRCSRSDSWLTNLRVLILLCGWIFCSSFLIACGESSQDQPADACKDVLCERGVCSDGACVNPESCKVSGDCLEDNYCTDDGVCVQNLCENVDCERGECQPSSGQCVNAGVCTIETQATDCLEGHLCYDNHCVTEAEICAELACEAGRGVCNPSARKCENADNCQGDDGMCLSGYFCNDENQCQTNICNNTTLTCDRGVCNPATGQCVNPDSCDSQTDCLDAHYCIAQSCTEPAQACSDCSGNQRCDYDDAAQSVTCHENENGCRYSLDCLGDRVCRDNTCVEPVACEADSYEANDSFETATDLRGLLAEGRIDASICDTDEDYYFFDVRGTGLSRGELIVDLRFAAEDVGIGALNVEVFDHTHQKVAEGTSDARGRLTLQRALTPAQVNQYFIKVRGVEPLHSSGIRYTVFADFISNNVIQACTTATELQPGITLSNSRQGKSYELGSSCTASDNLAMEDIYRIELERRSFVTLTVTPKPAAGQLVDLSISLRESCLTELSEAACVNAGGNDAVERIRQPLEPGEYFVIVQGPQANTGGPYQLEYNHEPVICSPGHGECTAEGSSKVCNAMGTGFDTIQCDQGCDETLGYCIRTPGDVCYAAIDASNGYTGEIIWSHFANEYEPAPGSCVSGAETSGPEVAYRVDIQPGHAMQVNLVTSTEYATLYLVDDCESMSTSCRATSAETISLPNSRKQKTLFHTNNTTEVQRLFVIADTDAEKLVGKAQISIAVGLPSCIPGQFQCGPEGLEECNQTGVGYELLRPCPFGCDSENFRCNPVQNNQCKGAVDIMASGGTFTNRIQDYTNNYNLGFSSCVGASTPGSDAVFMVEAKKGEVISVSVAADFNVALYMITNCNEPLASCEAASYHVQATHEALQYLAPEDGRYYIVVDSPTTAPVGWFTLNVSVETPMCPPGNLLGCVDDRTLSYCGDLGAPTLYACETGCTGMQCDTQTGGVCHDAKVLRSGEQATGNFAGENTLNPGEGAAGSCYFDDEPVGVNTFYAVELQAGDVLVASAYVPTSYTGQPNQETETMMIYLMDDCMQASSCLMNSSSLARPDLTYVADRDKTVYIVVSRNKSASSRTTTYTLNVDIIKPECTPGTRTCQDATTLEYCSSLGLLETLDCDGGCIDGACAVPGGDSCPDAIALPSTAFVSGLFDDRSNALNPGRGVKGQCDFGSYEANGRDAIYAIEMEAGQHLQAEFFTEGYSTWAYVLEDCNSYNSCVATAPGSFGGNSYAIDYIAQRTGTHYIVIDSSHTTATTSRAYEFFVNVSDPGCTTPGETSCIDANTLGACQPDGLVVAQHCIDGCSDGACNTPAGQICADAIPARSGESFRGGFLGLDTLNPGTGQVGSCDFGSREAPGRDTIYAVELKAGEQLLARVDSEATQTIMYVLEDCNQETSCLANTSSGKLLELTYTADTDKTVYLVVDRTDDFYAVAQYMLDIFVTSSACQPGTTQCLADGRTLSICDDNGNWSPYVCEGGCSDDACNTPRGDICQDAIALTHGSVVTGNWKGSNHVNPGRNEVGQCSFGTTEANGRDTIYAVTVPAGKVLSAALETSFTGAMIYLLEDCSDASSCLLNNPTRGSSSFFYPPATYERTMYIVVDRNGELTNNNREDTFTLSVTFEDPECFPGDSICGTEPDQIRMCNHLGVWEDYTCSSTCSAGQCDSPNADSCAEAVVLQPGESVTSNWTGTNTINPGQGNVGTCDFGTANMQGRERIYAINIDQGDVLTATLATTLSSARLYLLTDCLDATSCLDNTRRGGAGMLRYVAEDTGTIYVVVDGTLSTSQSTSFTLTVDVESPHCTKGERQCAPDGKTVQECNSFGVFDSYECDGTCTDGACDVPKGDHCLDAIPMVAGVEYAGDWLGTNSMHFGPGDFGQCNFGSTSHSQGRDTIFSLELAQGEQLRLDYATSASASSVQIYLMEDCELADSCLANMAMASSASSPTSMYYVADRDKTIFVVLDRTSTTTTATWTLKADIQPLCTIGATYCSDDNTLQICDQDQMFKPYACHGSCIDGRCEFPTGDACRDAIPVFSGDSIQGGWTMTDTINFGSGTAGKCSLGNQPGRETVYAVELVAGETLTANLETSQSNAILYISEDCAHADKCVAFEKNGASTLYYTAEQSRTVYIVVDRTTATSTANAYTLHINVQAPSCIPGEASTCLDEDTLQVCTYLGIYEEIPCQDGCSEGACNTPGGDTCYDAIVLQPGEPFTANYDVFTARTNPGTDTCMYASANNQPGVDAVFAIELNAGQMLHAELETSTSYAGMYVLESCDVDPARACVAAAPRSKSLQFLATASQTYYLVVDRTDASTTSNFTIRTSVEDTYMVCQPNSSTCDPATGTLRICSDDGTHYKTTTLCEHGCARDFCAAPPAVGGVVNDTCDTAQLITQSTRIFENYGRFTNVYNPGSSSCVGAATSGQDAVYRVYIPAREVLVASVTSGYASKTPAIYIVENCDDLANTCLGAHSESPTSTVGLPPQDTARFVYVIVDSRSASYLEPFIVDFEFRPSECTPGEQVCSGSHELSRCLDHHLYEQVNCPFGCSGTACIPPPNNTCEGAIDATQGLTITTDHNQYTNTYDPYDPDSGTSCTDYQTPGADTSAPGNDAIFFVDAERNETIYAHMGPTDGFNAALWITTDCDNAAKACVAGSDALPIGSHEIIEYIVEEPGRYYIIADSRFAPNSGVRNFTLEIAVHPPHCEAGTASCSDEDTLSYCLPNGTAIVDYTCEGGCSNGACQAPRGEICLDAIPIVQSGTFTGDFAHHTNHLDPGFGSCTGFDAPGPDAIYSVTLSAGQTLDVTLANTTASSDLSLYLVNDCTAPRNTCLAGSDQYGGVQEHITYTASGDETLYIVADSWAPDTQTGYALTVQIY